MQDKSVPSYALIDPDDDVLPTEVDMLCAGARPAQPVEWLWPGRIPIGKVTLMIGDPGLGKSLVALDVAARVSRGANWPDDDCGSNNGNPQSATRNPQSPPAANPRGSALILSAEDDLSDTIRARLDAAGADCDRVFVLPSLVDLRNEMATLRAAVDRLRDCRLVVIDPINAYVGPADSSFHTVVRRVLTPLAHLATEKRLAVLALTNLRKRVGVAIYRTAGSMGYVSVARAVWTVCRDPADPNDRRLFLPLKHNLAAAACGLAFTIVCRGPLAAPAVAWNLEPVTTNAEKIVGPAAKPPGPEALERQAAGQWLRTVLANGPRDAWDLGEEAYERGFSRRTLRRALHAIGGQTKKTDFVGGWEWSLPNNNPQEDKSHHQAQPDPFAETCPLGTPVDAEPGANSLTASIALLDRMRRQRRAEQPVRDEESNDLQSPHAASTSPIVDRVLQSFGEPPPTDVKCSLEANPDSTEPPNGRPGAI